MIILGIDPGTTTVGFSLLKSKNQKIEIIDFGVLKTPPKIDLGLKLLEIGKDINDLIKNYNVEKIVIEKLFFHSNVKTAIDVAQARGVILYESIKNNLIIEEYTPLQVKKAITGNGKANKNQLKKAIQILFGLEESPKYDDAADAIAMAYMGVLNKNFFS
ncbi:crossover junction endodeoxyribonuclease RuvC [Candidatus Gracilibacteria bacterium]|nr:MAG: crossover junction endodeoxyribonuclease RuvC [Candidatus Gracilibacteria bacterium]